MKIAKDELVGLYKIIKMGFGVNVFNRVKDYIEKDKNYNFSLYDLAGIIQAIKEDLFYEELKGNKVFKS